MAHPIVALIIAKAAEKFGERIGEEIGDAIFGEENDFSDIKELLEKLEAKIEEVLQYSRATYSLVEKLPELIQGIVDEQTLSLAHYSLGANYQAYVSLSDWNDTIGHSTLSELLSGWNIIIDMESSIERLIQLPKYGEFLLLVTNGQLLNAVQTGVEKKLNLINSALKVEQEKLDTLLTNSTQLINSEYIKSGELLEQEPWISWTAKPDKYNRVTRCVSKPCPACNGSIDNCNTFNEADTPWNNRRNSVNKDLEDKKNQIILSVNKVRSILLTKEINNKFEMRLNTSKEEIKAYHPHVKVIESEIAFPKG